MVTKLNRRNVLSLAGLGAGSLAFGMTGTRGAFAQSSKPMVVRVWGGVWETAMNKVGPAFTEGGGMEILIDAGSGSLPLLQQKPGQYDVAWLIGTDAARGLESGVLDPIDTSRIKNWSKIAPSLTESQRNGDQVSGVPISYTASGIMYKTDKVPFKITSWEDLWKPELKGQIALQNAPSIGGLQLVFVAARLFGSSPTDYEAGWAAIERLKPNVQFLYNISTDGITKLAAGSVAACVGIADQGIPLKSRGVETVIPVEGTTWSVQNLTIPSASNQKDAAYDFINYMLDEETQVNWSREGKAAPASTTVVLPEEVSANLMETAEVTKNLWPVSWAEFGANIPDWTKRWQTIFGS
jgi:putative spermidine/putrescine transport system substrate-binding protein